MIKLRIYSFFQFQTNSKISLSINTNIDKIQSVLYKNDPVYVRIQKFSFRTGDRDFNVDEGTETEIGVSKIIVHKNYTRSRLDSDIALLKLNRPVPFGQYVGTVCLPKKVDTVPLGTECFITGMGQLIVSYG